jgi:prenyltransferase beta subunit
MQRTTWVFLWSIVCLGPAWGQTAEEKKGTVAFLRALQTADGGFAPMPTGPGGVAQGSLRATTAALRGLKYFGGAPRDRDGCIRFVHSCFDGESGAFRDQPSVKGKPDVVVTAVGLMAVTELKMPGDHARAFKFLEDHAMTFEEIRMAAAGFESVEAKPATADRWIAQLVKLRNPDGTFGQGDDRVRFTGGAAAALLRLGATIEHRDDVIKLLKTGQRADGAYGKEGSAASDLETSYRVVRSLRMLKEKPADVGKCRAFVARCRHADGGYSVGVNGTSTVSGTYFASIILHWLDED